MAESPDCVDEAAGQQQPEEESGELYVVVAIARRPVSTELKPAEQTGRGKELVEVELTDCLIRRSCFLFPSVDIQTGSSRRHHRRYWNNRLFLGGRLAGNRRTSQLLRLRLLQFMLLSILLLDGLGSRLYQMATGL